VLENILFLRGLPLSTVRGLEQEVEELVIQGLSRRRELRFERPYELVHLLRSEKQCNELAKALEESSVLVTVFHTQDHELIDCIEVDKFCCLLFKVVGKALPESTLEIIAGGLGH